MELCPQDVGFSPLRERSAGAVPILWVARRLDHLLDFVGELVGVKGVAIKVVVALTINCHPIFLVKWLIAPITSCDAFHHFLVSYLTVELRLAFDIAVVFSSVHIEVEVPILLVDLTVAKMAVHLVLLIEPPIFILEHFSDNSHRTRHPRQ